MAVGELLLSAFLQVLFERLASRELLNLAGQEGVRSKLKKWKKKLKIIQAVLNDAEEKQLTDKAVKAWLEDLQDLAYDAEDVLDLFATETLRRNLIAQHQASTTKARKLIPDWFNKIKFDVNLRSRIKGITSRLEELVKEREALGLEILPGGRSATTVSQRPTSTSVPTEPAVYGRDEDKAEVLEMVLSDKPSDANFRVIAIVGMGGIGKTTLAREVYNDPAVDSFKFDIKAWTCVSEDFDVLRISKSLLESIASLSSSSNDLNEVQVRLRQALNGRKFLLVLDDVWNKSYGLWENLKAPFMACARGSKLIVTTRHADVASLMGSIEHYNLNVLSDDDCWYLFVKHAFENRDVSEHQSSELIREKVVEKCQGLPLAARTLGGLLRLKSRDGEWKDILNSKIWDLTEEESDILPVLKVSYYHLPSHLKRCFTYFAIFPKNCEFEEKALVLLWVAEGIIQSTNNEQLMDLGCKYFNDLLSRSFLQKFGGNSSKFVMHDLIHDLAQLVSGDTIFRLEEDSEQSIRFERVRHASYVSDRLEGENIFEVTRRFVHLRTLISLHSLHIDITYISHTVLRDFMHKFKQLRVLFLGRYFITQLPESLGNLRHLRFLNLSGTMIRDLPESTSCLLNLQILILKDCCRLIRLPSKMRNLLNMCYLDISGKNLLREMPLGMKDLKDLQILSNFIIGKGDGSGLEDLRNLKFLRNELCISGLENVPDLQATKEKILSFHKYLEVLSLLWQPQFDGSRNEVVEESVLAVLQPHRNLKELTIKYYGGTKFPSWLGDPSSINIVVLNLENCKKCKTLPSLGLLGSLKNLSIKGMTGLERLDYEVYGEDCMKPFQSLETLRFENLLEWEHWESIKENEQVERFPCLRELSIVRCPKLTGKLPNHLPALETLVIKECPMLVVSFSSLPMLQKLEIDECKGIDCSDSLMDSKSLNFMTLSKISEMGNWPKQGFHNVELLKIVNCEELICFWQNVTCVDKPLQGMHSFTSLKELSIEKCSSLDLFPEANFLSNLTFLEIKDWKALKSLPEGMRHNNTCLKSLYIDGCDSLTYILRGTLPSSLNCLHVCGCKKLQCLVDYRDDTFISSSSLSRIPKESLNTSVLKELYISDCPSLTCISSGGQLPLSLQQLFIYFCPKLESVAERFNNSACLTTITLQGCEKLKSLPRGLHHLSYLECFTISRCPSIVTFPERGLPNNTNLINVFIVGLDKLQTLPEGMNNLSALQYLEIRECPRIISLSEGLPTNLRSLSIDGHLYKPVMEWGLHNLTSLRDLSIVQCSDAVSFPEEEMNMILPTSLTNLLISGFPKLKYLSSIGFQRLASLKLLFIDDCPKLKSFPNVGLPSSLSKLDISNCPLLKERCRSNKGKEWSKIAHIQCVLLDDKLLCDSEEEE